MISCSQVISCDVMISSHDALLGSQLYLICNSYRGIMEIGKPNTFLQVMCIAILYCHKNAMSCKLVDALKSV